VNPAVWITIIILLILGLNIFAVGIYGEAEFCFASVKLVTILGLLILAFIIDLGGSPRHHRLGFEYWRKSIRPPLVKSHHTDFAQAILEL